MLRVWVDTMRIIYLAVGGLLKIKNTFNVVTSSVQYKINGKD